MQPQAATTSPVRKASDLVAKDGHSRPKARPPVVAEFVSACEEESVRAFVANLRRLLPSDDRTPDFAEESERFQKSARQLVRMRGSREAEAAAVDLRVLLLTAESVRSAPALRRADAAGKAVLGAWDDVLKGNPADRASQLSCVRLMKGLKDLR